MTNEAREKLINKMQAMKKLAENAGTPEEAAAAAEMLQKLLEQYHIDISEIDENELRLFERENKFVNRDIMINQGNGTGWRRELIWALAPNNWCRAIDKTHGRKGNAKMGVVGREVDVDAVELMNNWLSTVLLQQANREIAGGMHKLSGTHPVTYKDSFLYAAVEVIRIRLARQKRHFEGLSDNTAAIVTTSDKIVGEKYNEFYPKVYSLNNAQIGSSDWGAAAGAEFGAKVELSPVRLSGRSETPKQLGGK